MQITNRKPYTMLELWDHEIIQVDAPFYEVHDRLTNNKTITIASLQRTLHASSIKEYRGVDPTVTPTVEHFIYQQPKALRDRLITEHRNRKKELGIGFKNIEMVQTVIERRNNPQQQDEEEKQPLDPDGRKRVRKMMQAVLKKS